LDPETRISFIFAGCRPTQPLCGAARADRRSAAAASALLLLLRMMLLCIANLLMKNQLLVIN